MDILVSERNLYIEYLIFSLILESTNVQSSEAPELVRQNTQTFHDLNKVQRQILHPVPASMTDSFSLAASIKHKDGVRLPARTNYNNNTSANNQDKHFSDLQLPGTVNFLRISFIYVGFD